MMGIRDDKGKKKPEAGCGWNATAKGPPAKGCYSFLNSDLGISLLDTSPLLSQSGLRVI
jgi:hypothetical protein